jgi:hypothetical protein
MNRIGEWAFANGIFLLSLTTFAGIASAETTPPVSPIEAHCYTTKSRGSWPIDTVVPISLVGKLLEGTKIDQGDMLSYLELVADNASQSAQMEQLKILEAEAAQSGTPVSVDREVQTIEWTVSDMLGDVYKGTYSASSKGIAGDKIPSNPSWKDFFAKVPSVAISCGPQGVIPGWSFRVRGASSDLVYANSAQGFATASKATASESYNGLTKTAAYTAQAAIGGAYTWETPNGADSFWGTAQSLVIYLGANYGSTKVTGKPSKTSAHTIDFGVLGSENDPFSGVVPAIIGIAPDYLINQQDGSRIASLHLTYLPYVLDLLNQPFEFDSSNKCSWTGVRVAFCEPYWTIGFNFLSDFGHYVNRGSLPDRLMDEDYIRSGGQVGFNVNLKNWYDLTVTDTNLYGFSGYRRDLNDLDASLTLYFGSQNIAGLTLAYKNGLLEQTAKREESWTVGITVKY